MKILWVKSEFLHPTERGGQIRTLETLRRIHQRHEVHYAAYAPSRDAEGPRRAAEYCSAAHVVEIPFPPRGTPRFFAQVIANLASPLPFIVYRYRSRAMTRLLDQLHAQHRFDAVVCDFLAVAANFRDLRKCVLFQHNVESMIFERHADQASGRLHQAYFASQARRTDAFERQVCRSVAHVVAVSDADRESMQMRYGVSRITAVPTGVDVPFFAPRDPSPKSNDLVFVGSMDYMPNVDAMQYFIAEVLPRIRARRPDCNVVIAGRAPGPEVRAWAAADPRIQVTGTVPDIRPHLWNAKVSIVPMRVGGGTRLKIYESMAARVPVVSTTVGAEGLAVEDGQTIFLADDPASFADRCLALMEDQDLAARLACAGEALATRFSWDHSARQFESILESA